jgi:hypothetical protein
MKLNQDNEPDEFTKYVIAPRENPVKIADVPGLRNQLSYSGDTTASNFLSVSRINLGGSIRLADGTILQGQNAISYLRDANRVEDGQLREPGSADEPITAYRTTAESPTEVVNDIEEMSEQSGQTSTPPSVSSPSTSSPSTTSSSSMMPDVSGGLVVVVLLVVAGAAALFGGGD